MKLAYSLLIIPLVVTACAQPVAKTHIEPGRYVKTLKVGELQRSYILRVPKQYDNKTKLPLVFLFHGWTSSAAQAEVYTEFGAKADKEGFILVVPDGTEGIGKLKGWNPGFINLGVGQADDVKFTSDVLDQLEKDMYVDEKRVFVAGHSNGAMMAYTIGSKLGDRVAAIGVVSGTIGTAKERAPDPKAPVSAIIFHGKQDPTVPYDDTVQALIKGISAPDSAKWCADKAGCSAPTRTTKYDGDVLIDLYGGGKDNTEIELVTLVKGGHDWPKEGAAKISATDMMWDFFKAHPKR